MIVYERTDRTGQVRETSKHNSDKPGLEDFGIEAAKSFDEVRLCRHYLMDIFVNHRNLIETGRNESDSPLAQVSVHVFPVEGLVGFGAAHDSSCAMGGGMKRFHIAFPADDKAWSGH